ncbi:MAG: hypothetical protein ACLUKN_16230 [Bacilli bacterium]
MLDIKEEALLEKRSGNKRVYFDADPHPLRKFSIAPISLESFFAPGQVYPKISAKAPPTEDFPYKIRRSNRASDAFRYWTF